MVLGAGTAWCEAPIPDSAAGLPVKLELDIFGGGVAATAAEVGLEQLDERGAVLASPVAEGLSASVPAGKAVFNRVNGRLDPKARRLRLKLTLSGDAPRVIVQRLNLRVGEDLAFNPFKVKGE